MIIEGISNLSHEEHMRILDIPLDLLLGRVDGREGLVEDGDNALLLGYWRELKPNSSDQIHFYSMDRGPPTHKP